MEVNGDIGYCEVGGIHNDGESGGGGDGSGDACAFRAWQSILRKHQGPKDGRRTLLWRSEDIIKVQKSNYIHK